MPESFVKQATGRCSIEGSKYWFNCNPDGPYHFFKLEWIDKAKEKNILILHFTMDDNLSLSPKIKERYTKMYSGLFFKRFILGLWVLADGIIYDMFSEEKHVVKTEDRAYTEFYISCDMVHITLVVLVCGAKLINGIKLKNIIMMEEQQENKRQMTSM